MDYYKIICKNLKDKFVPEILVALLAEIGYESFEEEENELTAYIQAPDFNLDILLQSEMFKTLNETNDLEHEFIKAKNWNAVWESNYDPVTIKNCHIRAPFHKPNPEADFNILLNPKMAFGTAHHETTAMMIEHILVLDCKNLRILDMGSGTAVLAILASMKGASELIAIDNDEWAYHNAIENLGLNGVENIQSVLGDASNLDEYGLFDIILANINKNILLNDIKHYSKSLKSGGKIYFSGFYENDLEDIKIECLKNGLVFVKYFVKNNWTAAEFYKQ
jgi:ribosomal protein L11 methyltransferase